MKAIDRYNVNHPDSFLFSAKTVDLDYGDTRWNLREILRALHDELPIPLLIRAMDATAYRLRTLSRTKKGKIVEVWVGPLLTWISQPSPAPNTREKFRSTFCEPQITF